MNPLFPTLLEEFQKKIKSFTQGVVREADFADYPSKIMVMIGMRRTGKTHYLFQKMSELMKTIPLERMLYLNFEDDRLLPSNDRLLSSLLDSFFAYYPENHDEEAYLFLDEIQNIAGWHAVIRRYFDTKKVRIYLTGSSAKLLSKEIATSLRGRSFAQEMWPFSFKEYLNAKSFALTHTPPSEPTFHKLHKELQLYLLKGGFPEVFYMNSEEDCRQVLQDYVSVVILRDIVERYKITNLSLIRYMIKTLLKNVGCPFSINKFYHDLVSQAFTVGKATLYEYLGYIEDSYLAFPVPLYSESLRKTQTNPRKIYAIDTGLVKAYASSMNANWGHYFENLVFLDLKRQGHEIFYYLTNSRKEIDFLSQDKTGKWHMYQVCWNMDDESTISREMAALEEAEHELGISGSIITPQTYISSLLMPKGFLQKS